MNIKNNCRVMIYEPDSRGHRLNYVRLLIEGLSKNGFRPIAVLSREAKNSPAFLTHLKKTEQYAEFKFISTVDYKTGSIRFAWQKACELHRLIKKISPDHVYIPHGDGVGSMLGMRYLFKQVPQNLEIIMVGGHVSDSQKKIIPQFKYRLQGLLLERIPWQKIHLISPVTLKWFQHYAPRLASRTRIIADPVPALLPQSKLKARKELDLDPNGKWIGCLGALNKLKGVDRLVEAFFYNDIPPSNLKLLLAGSLSDELAWIKDEFREQIKSGNLVLLDKYLDDEQFHKALFALDVLCLPYRGNRWASSGLLLQTAAAGIPILTSSRGWIAKLTDKYELGSMTDIENLPAFHDAIEKSIDNSKQRAITEKAEKLLEFNSETNFTEQLLESLKLKTGQSQTKPPADGTFFYKGII